MKHVRKAILALGSNMGNRRQNLIEAVAAIQDFCDVVFRSKIYQTPPVGFSDQRDFLNAALAVRTECEPVELLRLCKILEEKMGRKHSFRNAPRPIDVDIIFFEGYESDSEELTVPHPRWRERDFVKTPLIDLMNCGAFEGEFFDDVRDILENSPKMFPPFSAF